MGLSPPLPGHTETVAEMKPLCKSGAFQHIKKFSPKTDIHSN